MRRVLHTPVEQGMLILTLSSKASQYDGLTLLTRQGTRIPLLHALPPPSEDFKARLRKNVLTITSTRPFTLHLPRSAKRRTPTAYRVQTSTLLLSHPPTRETEAWLDTPADAERHDTQRIPTILLHFPAGEYALRMPSLLPTRDQRLSLPHARRGLAGAAVNTFRLLLPTRSAGYPWFPEHWYRDLAYALPFLPREEQSGLLSLLLEGVTSLTNHPRGSAPAFDLPGVVAFAFRHPHTAWLVKTYAEEVGHAFALACMLLKRYQDETGLVRTPRGASWMDTADRPYPLEVQAGVYAACRLAAFLTRDESFSRMALRVQEGVRTRMLQHGLLIDDDPAHPRIRPNVFLAYHYAPSLFSREEWQGFFTRTLPHLTTTPFNGLYSTISIHDPSYHAWDDGLPSKAYHHGDSWYYLNFLILKALRETLPLVAALHAQPVLTAARKAMRATTPHLLPEVSSHAEPRAEGAWAQLWSAAAFAWLTTRIPTPW